MFACIVGLGKHFGQSFCELAVGPSALWLEDVTRKTRSGLNHERLSLIPLEVIVQLCCEASEAEFYNVLGLGFWFAGITKARRCATVGTESV